MSRSVSVAQAFGFGKIWKELSEKSHQITHEILMQVTP
jgi:hypothetical protein